MKLSSPSWGVFIISFVLFVLVLAVSYFGVKVPAVSGHNFEMLLVAYVVLLVGNLFRGI